MMRETKKLNLVVLMGGPSSEHDISLKTGTTLVRNLNPEKYNLKPIIITRDRKWLTIPEYHPLEKARDVISELTTSAPPSRTILEERQALGHIKNQDRADVVFIAMHGEYGEDGSVQGLLEVAGVPYTGSGVLASSLGMNKPASLRIFYDQGLHVPDFITLTNKDEPLDSVVEKWDFPLVVKPADRGSSVGVTIMERGGLLKNARDKAFRYSKKIMIQKYIRGREIACGVIDDGLGTMTALQPSEIIPRERRFFDYYSKYTPGASNEITPPNLPQDTIRRIQETAMKTHSSIGCSGMSRTDMILDGREIIWVLEINTIPGLTETSLLPQAARAVGIEFPELLDRIIEAALNRAKSDETRVSS